ncbi:hypothetical protein [Shinella sp.]|uniref:hypothetical protein n=1 Tax=Shinella sp. TaxID=1870904 RepID=UPI0029BA0EF3|nr:hypothetical protein [Shinella sp.]MDX3976569.1 hypothetical protein [Shinella sp.]
MAKLSASLVVSLTDRTAAGARNVKKSLSDIRRAERDLELARRNQRLTRVERAEEALQIARDRDAHRLAQDRDRALAERQRRMGVFYSGVTFAATAAGYAVAKSYSQFAEVERKIGRVALKADKAPKSSGQPSRNCRILPRKQPLVSRMFRTDLKRSWRPAAALKTRWPSCPPLP